MAIITAGSYIIVTVAADLFEGEMVGREFWKKYNALGEGGGRARIVQVLGPTQVFCKVLSPFDSNDPIGADDWFLTTDTIYGLNYLEGETVGVIADGGTHIDVTVRNGTVKLTEQHSRVFVGYKYKGIIETLNIDPTGSSQAKKRRIHELNLGFVNTIGPKVGTSYYDLEKIVFRSTDDKTSRPPALYTGNKIINYKDRAEATKKILVLVQDEPLPCTWAGFDMTVETE